MPYAKLSNPQSLNLYAYVFNNPLAAVDPDGHFLQKNGPATCEANALGNGCSTGEGDTYQPFAAQQQIGPDPTLPTEVPEPEPNFAERLLINQRPT